MKKFAFCIMIFVLVIAGCIGAGASNMDFVDGSYLYQEDDYLLGIPEKTTPYTVKQNFTSDDVTVSGDNSVVATGAVVSSTRELTVVVKGDVNGDGRVSTVDYILQKKYVGGVKPLEGAFYRAADTNEDGEVNSSDYLQVKKYFTGKSDLFDGMSAVPYDSQFEKKDYSERKAGYRMDRSKINIGLYGWEKGTDNVFTSEAYVREAKEDFGADFIASGRNAKKLYNICSAVGMGVFAKNANIPKYSINSEAKPTLGDYSQFDCLKDGTYNDYDCFWGEEVFDEPVYSYYPWLTGAQQIYDGHFDDRFIFFNLNPAPNPYMINSTAFGASSYVEYVNEYAKQVDTDYMCVDIYPFDNGKAGFHSEYLLTMDTVSAAARESGKDFWIILQSGSTDKAFKMTPAQIQWQVYTSLAYGADTIMYASYMPWWFVDNTCFMNNDGTKTELWQVGKDVNQVVKALSPVITEYDSLGVTGFNYKNTFVTSKQMRNQIARNDARGFGGVRGFSHIESTGGLLVGSFEAKDGNGYGMMLVESTDVYDMNKSSVVTFKVADPDLTKVTAYPGGVETVLTAVDGVYTVELESGEGCFVTVE